MDKSAKVWLNRAMKKPKNIGLLIFDGAQSLTVCGSAAVFAAANDIAQTQVYSVHILSPQGGPITTMSAITVMTDKVSSVDANDFDTVLISGGGAQQVQDAFNNDVIRRWVLQAALRCRRLGSTSFPGTLGLAHLGLLDGARVTTHWSATSILAQRCPHTTIDPEVLYVEDGRIWTAAGVTSAIDMSIEMVARDLGEHVANQITKRLVLAGRRPGDVAQVSTVTATLEKLDRDFSGLISWIHAHLSEPLDITALASKAAMSPRNFQRKFRACIGESPARFLETIRLEHARTLLSSGISSKNVAFQCGYSNAQQFAKAYLRRFGITPST